MTLSRRTFGLALPALGLASVPAQGLRIGAAAPDFALRTFDGRTVTLEDLRGQVVVLNFWATWCAPCKVELPLLERYYRQAGRFGLRIFAVATEDSLSPQQLRPLAKVLTIPMARTLSGPYKPLGAVPTNYVIDRQGLLRYARAGAFDADDMNRLFGPLLRQTAPERDAVPRDVA